MGTPSWENTKPISETTPTWENTADAVKEEDGVLFPLASLGGKVKFTKVKKGSPLDYSDPSTLAGKLRGYGNTITTGLPEALVAALTGNTKKGDVKRIFQGNAPLGKEYAVRQGFSEEPFLKDNEYVTLSPAGAVGAGYDVAANILSGKALETVGKGLFKVPFMKPDARLSRAGKPLLSDTLKEAGETPVTRGDVVDAVTRTEAGLGREVSKREAPVILSGKTGSMKSALKRLQEEVDRLKGSSDPDFNRLGNKWQRKVDERLVRGESPEIPSVIVKEPTQSSVLDEFGKPIVTVKERLIPGKPAKPGPTYLELKDIKDSAWKNRPKDVTAAEYDLYNSLGGGTAEEMKSIANNVGPGLGDDIYTLNQKRSSLLASMPEAQRMELSAAGKIPVTEVDLMALGFDPGVAALKQVGKVWKLPGAWTYSGRGLETTGSGLGKLAPFSPWINLMRQNKREEK